MQPRDRLIFALDVPNIKSADRLLNMLEGHIGVVKVGLELFTAEGPALLDIIDLYGIPILLDLKLHDIPATVERTVRGLSQHKLLGITAHTAGGFRMLKDAAEVMPIYGVTVLTSLNDANLGADGCSLSVADLVERRADRAYTSGCVGIVASPHEVATLRRQFPNLDIITPGIRVVETDDDQKRVATPFNAMAWGASRIVVGRPIRDADDPAAAADAIVADITQGLKARD